MNEPIILKPAQASQYELFGELRDRVRVGVKRLLEIYKLERQEGATESAMTRALLALAAELVVRSPIAQRAVIVEDCQKFFADMVKRYEELETPPPPQGQA